MTSTRIVHLALSQRAANVLLSVLEEIEEGFPELEDELLEAMRTELRAQLPKPKRRSRKSGV